MFGTPSELVEKHSKSCECEWMDSEDPLFILYMRESTGKPKGVLHTTSGFMIGSFATSKHTLDFDPEEDVYFCTPDCGLSAGHTYVTYGPMLNCATQVLSEGVPKHPQADRVWKVCEKYKVGLALIESMAELDDQLVS